MYVRLNRHYLIVEHKLLSTRTHEHAHD